MIEPGTRVVVRIPKSDGYFRQYERPGVIVSYEGEGYQGDADAILAEYQIRYDEPWPHNDRDCLMTDAIIPEHWLILETFVIEEDAIGVTA